MFTDLIDRLHRQWGWIALRGVVAILFGVVTLARPGITLAALVITWAIYSITDGIVALFAAWQLRQEARHTWPLVALGLLGVAAGLITLRWPAISAFVLLMVIAGWALSTGILQIVAAIRMRKQMGGEWALGLSGALSVIFGLLMFVSPGAGALAMVWVIAAYAIGFGALLVILGFRLRAYPSRETVEA